MRKRITLLPLLLFLLVCTSAQAQNKTSPISRLGWRFDRSDFKWPTWSDPHKEQAKGTFKGATGWVEYDISIPQTNWYALWEGGVPIGWSRSLYVDGKPIIVEMIGEDADQLPSAQRKKSSVHFKEVNLYLEAGVHKLRFERLGFPGVLPSAWELRASTGKSDECLFAQITSRRIVAPGESVTLTVMGGAEQATQYNLILTEQITGKIHTAATVSFPASQTPLTKEVQLVLPEKGLYLITAQMQGATLRPADLKAGYVMAVKAASSPKQQTPVVTQLSLGGLFTNDAVLQRDKPLPIWGQAPAGEQVTVTLAKQVAQTVADTAGRWRVTLDPMPAGGPYSLSVQCDAGKMLRKGILIGEVWLLSGQSNMGGPLLTCDGGMDEARKAAMPMVRMGRVHYNNKSGSINNVHWMRAASEGNPQKLKNWLGIHFAFGQMIHNALKVPVGLIAAHRGGTVISTWTSLQAHQQDPAFQGFYEQYLKSNTPANQEGRHLSKTVGAIARWKRQVAQAPKEAVPMPPQLVAEMFLRNQPARLYDQLIKPCAPYAIRGVLWYQGETDSSMAAIYPKRFARMVADWRTLWQSPDMPFITVQISYGSGKFDDRQPSVNPTAQMRDAQIKSLKVPHTYMVVSHDLMQPKDNVHYHDKLPVGRRLGRVALAQIYGQDVIDQGPMYSRLTVEGSRIRLHFDHTDGGLVTQGKTLNGFSIAGADQKWYWAKAKIEGQAVLIEADAVKQPVAVRYGWSGYRNANLFNGAGLPAPTFRTDDWPLSTEGVDFTRLN